MIYLDSAATTKPSATALSEFNRIAERQWMNPSSKVYSAEAALELTAARKAVAKIVGARPEEIIFTSGATEAANWVISSTLSPGDNLITTRLEHPCVYNAAMNAASNGINLKFVDNDGAGLVSLSHLMDLLEECRIGGQRTLVAIIGANNEIGTIQPIARIAEIVHRFPRAVYFSDNTQLWAHGAPRLDGVDFACASAHKFGGLKGTGFLYAREPSFLSPMILGGHQEFGLRAGTENVGGIVAMAAAFSNLDDPEAVNVRRYIESLANGAGFTVNGGSEGEVVPNIVSVTLPDCGALEMIVALAMDDIYLSAGSACSAGSQEPSRILKAIGLTDEQALRTIRISFDRKIRLEDIKYVFERIDYYRKALIAND